MNIIICGAGRVGFTIAKQLSEQGHSITVIDQSSEDIQKIDEALDVKAIVGKATYPSILEKAIGWDVTRPLAPSGTSVELGRWRGPTPIPDAPSSLSPICPSTAGEAPRYGIGGRCPTSSAERDQREPAIRPRRPRPVGHHRRRRPAADPLRLHRRPSRLRWARGRHARRTSERRHGRRCHRVARGQRAHRHHALRR